jgi:formamidopyrimidine-DNA glycosylase
MENCAVMIFHLGMTGRLGLFPKKAPLRRHDHIRIRLDNDMELRFNDSRRFGSIQVVNRGTAMSNLFSSIGPEPFSVDFSAEYLFSKAKNRHQPVKNFLMDSRVVAGIGNIYASEILFCAAIRPTRPACNLTRHQCRKIIACSREILQKAIKAGGTTIADYVNASGQAGYFQLELMVYGRHKGNCRKCEGAVSKIVQAGRASYFCKKCQR